VLVTLGILLVAVPPHALPTTYWLLVPIVFLLQAAFNLGLAFLVARIGSDIPDARHLVPYLTRIWLYGSAVMFSIDRFNHVPLAAAAVRANPMFQFLDSYRALLLDGRMPSPNTWSTLTLWAAGSLFIGAVFFWRREVSYGRFRQ
jgi:teichoic acid transport system permease protein